MPRTRSLAWSELKIGVLTVAAVVIAAVTVFMLTGDRGFFWQRYGLKTRFTNVAGLKPGSPVRVAGVEVGTVNDVVLVGDQVDVTFDMNKTMRDRITTSSLAKLGSISLLGESAVDVTPSTKGTPIPEWGYVEAAPVPAQISDLTDKAGQGISELSALVHDIHQGRGTVGQLMTDDRLYNELQRFVATANELTDGIKQGRGSVGQLLTDRKTADTLNASLKNIETLTRQLNDGKGSLGKLLQDDGFANSLASATDNLNALAGKLNHGEGTAGKLLNNPALFNRLDAVTARLEDVMTKLNNGEGTAGQLLKDKQLYENMNKVTSELASLITEIKKDPRKYLNVKVSIF